MEEDDSTKLERAIIDEFRQKYDFRIGSSLGKGGFGVVYKIYFKDKVYAGKLVKKEGKVNECDLILQFKSPYIVKIVKIFNSGIYNFVLMEKADLKDLNSFIEDTKKNSIQKLLINPFYSGIIGNNLFKYFAKQLIIGLESLERIGYSHFDIKPGNILIFKNYISKLSDFSFLRNQKEIARQYDMLKIPGGTDGFCPPEFYLYKDVTIENAKKHDYFSLGSTLFALKYGTRLLSIPIEYLKNKIKRRGEIIDYIYDTLLRQINLIKSNKLFDKEFIKFLCDLIQFKPEDRPNFEKIYRNKWINENSEEISKIFHINELDKQKYNPKLILELNKSDFLLDKKKELNQKRKKFIFKKKRK